VDEANGEKGEEAKQSHGENQGEALKSARHRMRGPLSGKATSVSRPPTVTALEIVEDFSSTARCDEGFLQLRRLRVRNRRSDGSHSQVYRVDVVDRPRLDAVAVLVWRRSATGLEFLTRQNLRPAAWFRSEKTPVMPEARQ
jgi:hypothetical protein